MSGNFQSDQHPTQTTRASKGAGTALQESNAITARFGVELAAAQGEALEANDMVELSRGKHMLGVSVPSYLAYVLRSLVAAPLAGEQDSGGKSSAGAAGHGDAVMGGVGDAAIPGTAAPTGSAPTRATAMWAAALPAALATAGTVSKQAVEATVQDAAAAYH